MLLLQLLFFIPEFVADDTSIDLDGGGTTVNFTSTSQHASHFMWEFGDGSIYPTGADSDDPTGTESSGVACLQPRMFHIFTQEHLIHNLQ